ncbi:MAG: hypothetical protein IOD12_08575 [Silvanigrellales bacterium]|nr:hypothetical protein [Silvanigrellales bacterium]
MFFAKPSLIRVFGVSGLVLILTSCGQKSGSSGAVTEAYSLGKVDCQSLSAGELQRAQVGSDVYKACVVQGCGDRRSNRVQSKWSGEMFSARCQARYRSWSLGSTSSVVPSSDSKQTEGLALVGESTSAAHGNFCASVERLSADTDGERNKRSDLMRELEDSLGQSPTESGFKQKLTELLYCPAEFEDFELGGKYAIDVSKKADESGNGGNRNGRGTIRSRSSN